MAATTKNNTPLTCGIEGDELVIRIGIDTLSFSTAHSPHLYDYDEHGASDGPYIKITDSQLFATDIVRALKHEEEDGSGPLSDLFDQAAERALDDGAESVDYDWKPEIKPIGKTP